MSGPNDPINPEHYTSGGIEAIDVMRAKLEPAEFAGFCRGNVLKYVMRAGKKGDAREDLRKAQWYLNVLLAELTPDSTGGGS